MLSAGDTRMSETFVKVVAEPHANRPLQDNMVSDLTVVGRWGHKACYELHTAQQANKLRDELLGQGIATLFRKPADREDGGLVSQRTVFSELEFRFLLY